MRRMLALCEEQEILQPQAAYGYWKAAGQGNDLIVFDTGRHDRSWRGSRCRGSRRRTASASPISSATSTTRERDVIGLQVVTVGQKASEIVARLVRG